MQQIAEISCIETLVRLEAEEQTDVAEAHAWLATLPLIYNANASEIFEEQLVLRLAFITGVYSALQCGRLPIFSRTRVCIAQLEDKLVECTHALQEMQTTLQRIS